MKSSLVCVSLLLCLTAGSVCAQDFTPDLSEITKMVKHQIKEDPKITSVHLERRDNAYVVALQRDSGPANVTRSGPAVVAAIAVSAVVFFTCGVLAANSQRAAVAPIE